MYPTFSKTTFSKLKRSNEGQRDRSTALNTLMRSPECYEFITGAKQELTVVKDGHFHQYAARIIHTTNVFHRALRPGHVKVFPKHEFSLQCKKVSNTHEKAPQYPTWLKHAAVIDRMTSPGTLDLVLHKKMRGGGKIGKQCDYATDVYVHYLEKMW